MHEELWCIKCKCHGHDKDHCPVFVNYLVGGGLIPLRPEVKRLEKEIKLACLIDKPRMARQGADDHTNELEHYR